MKKAIAHLRANVVAYLALFVALGGTSYAAVSLPRNSVGTAQLRNGAVTAGKLAKGSVTPSKLDGRDGVPYVAFWARVDNTGRILASSKPATTTNWAGGVDGQITFRGALSSDCFALASVLPSPSSGANGYVTLSSGSFQGKTNLLATMTAIDGHATPLSLQVADICP
jgi:hypothetical protein